MAPKEENTMSPDINAGLERRRQQQINRKKPVDVIGWSLLLLVISITILSYPQNFMTEKVSVQQVWYFGWITAVSTGLGVLPFCIFSAPDKFWMGVSNAVAAGMMMSASYSLAFEGATFDQVGGFFGFHPVFRTAGGFLIGVGFILATKNVLERYEHLKMGEMEGINAQKMILIIFVMTLHSLTEGIGIGVSFGGTGGQKLGQFISLSLAVHNVPEGLAVALVLTSRRVSKLRACLWSIMTSIPQPLMAIPAFLFVERFMPLLPAGLGFASGAMAYVAVFELLIEAVEDCNVLTTGVTGIAAFALMAWLQELVKGI